MERRLSYTTLTDMATATHSLTLPRNLARLRIVRRSCILGSEYDQTVG